MHLTDARTPCAELSETPSSSNAAWSFYPSSDFRDFDNDPFFGADFDTVASGTPSFLADSVWGQTAISCDSQIEVEDHVVSYPLTPAHTASLYAASPRPECKDVVGLVDTTETLPKSISPRQLDKVTTPTSITLDTSALTPSLSTSGDCASEDALAPAISSMYPQSPRVTISVWDRDDAPVHTFERFSNTSSPRTVRGRVSAPVARDTISTARHDGLDSARRGTLDDWRQTAGTRPGGIEPRKRSSDNNVSSINELDAQRAADERNEDVGRWLSNNMDDVSAPVERSPEEIQALQSPANDDGIPLGHHTENRYVSGQAYFEGPGGDISAIDREIIASSRIWADAPRLPDICTNDQGRHQPETSQAAMARFERLCRDNDSVLSRSATWGTRRRSLPSGLETEEAEVTSGNFLKRLSIINPRGQNSQSGEKTTSKPGSFLRDLRGLVRRTSVNQLRKRSRSRSRAHSVNGQGEEIITDHGETGQVFQRDGDSPHLSLPVRSTSSGKKSSGQSINTTLASMGQNLASIWTGGHFRSGSVGGVSRAPSPGASGGGLTVKSSVRRPRSKSEIPQSSTSSLGMESMSGLVNMWRRPSVRAVTPVSRGNEPRSVAVTATTAAPAPTAAAAADEDDDDEDEPYEDNTSHIQSNYIEDFTPNFAGFRQHISKLNPDMGKKQEYLLDRIAHHQVQRYKKLLTAKVEHLRQGPNCPSGILCTAAPNALNATLPTEIDDEDSPSPSPERNIHLDTFPTGIPFPPVQYFPSEFECPLCYEKKKCQKPSDWTKHVHEDLQPFTCTWASCRDATKMFKRKADWVRHENEGHRHLEWWMCDVDGCRHTCYRRDNFLQHLVREHKYAEPRVKTRAAVKHSGHAGGGAGAGAEMLEPAWQKVEKCHVETSVRPQDEPCRFCGDVFPTWKKLTVHLGKHMERIALSVLRAVEVEVAAGDVSAETVVSPVEESGLGQNLEILFVEGEGEGARGAGGAIVGGCGEEQEKQQQQEQLLRHSYDGQHGASLRLPNPFAFPVLPTGSESYQQQQQTYNGRFEDMVFGIQPSNFTQIPRIDPGYNATQPVQEIPSVQAADYLSFASSSKDANNGTGASTNNNKTDSDGNFMYMPTSADVEPFPQFSTNVLGLQDTGHVERGGQLSDHMGYDGMMDVASVRGHSLEGYETGLYSYALPADLNVGRGEGGQQQQQQQQQRDTWDDEHGRAFMR
ncbi:hypothetical protein E4U56_007043 [Claviceps arundinis]|uniref:C2H2-type domain-containing protein n=1 Tax=Claviceps arundinis TaxID=1623583 RepID=A0A9P7MW93_9HYPO|nr:hypothetical protein E4U56_007043 [Claviceps arundinis]